MTDAPAAGAKEKTLLMQDSHKKDAIQRIQIGLTGLAGVVLLVGLANIVVEKAGVSDGGTVTAIDDAPPRLAGSGSNAAGPAEKPTEPLAELGVAPPSDNKEADDNVPGQIVPDLEPNPALREPMDRDRKSTRLNSSH